MKLISGNFVAAERLDKPWERRRPRRRFPRNRLTCRRGRRRSQAYLTAIRLSATTIRHAAQLSAAGGHRAPQALHIGLNLLQVAVSPLGIGFI